MTGEPKCPTCQSPVQMGPGNVWRPFCSQRCRLIDLGEWLRGARSLPADEDSFTAQAPEDGKRH